MLTEHCLSRYSGLQSGSKASSYSEVKRRGASDSQGPWEGWRVMQVGAPAWATMTRTGTTCSKTTTSRHSAGSALEARGRSGFSEDRITLIRPRLIPRARCEHVTNEVSYSARELPVIRRARLGKYDGPESEAVPIAQPQGSFLTQSTGPPLEQSSADKLTKSASP